MLFLAWKKKMKKIKKWKSERGNLTCYNLNITNGFTNKYWRWLHFINNFICNSDTHFFLVEIIRKYLSIFFYEKFSSMKTTTLYFIDKYHHNLLTIFFLLIFLLVFYNFLAVTLVRSIETTVVSIRKWIIQEYIYIYSNLFHDLGLITHDMGHGRKKWPNFVWISPNICMNSRWF